ncbi:MAG: hypothetical protein ABIQ99_14230 [Thermoflexales bacterium]
MSRFLATSTASQIWNKRALQLARLLLVAFAIVSAATFLLGATRFPSIVIPYSSTVAPNSSAWTPELTQLALGEMAWPATTYAWLNFGRDVWSFLVFTAIAFVLLWRKSDDWFGLFVALTFVINGQVGSWLPEALNGLAPGLGFLKSVNEREGALGWQFFFFLLYVFPSGRFVPGWTRWLLIGWMIPNMLGFRNPLSLVLAISLVLIAVASQIYRFFWKTDPVQRQQTKWVVAVIGLVVLGFPAMIAYPQLMIWAAGSEALFQRGSGTALVVAIVVFLSVNGAVSLFPMAIGMAILRYRLWDIDVIVRRTLVYGLLSALLAGIYFGTVALLQTVITAVTGQARNELVTVVSTLAIAGLVLPLRNGLQKIIDRRFYRRKFNAELALARFSAEMRDAVEIDAISTQLMDAVEETMQPERIHVWLAGAGPRKTITEAQS